MPAGLGARAPRAAAWSRRAILVCMTRARSDADFKFLVDIVLAHRNRCRKQLRFLRRRAGRTAHRKEVLAILRSARADLEALQSGDSERADALHAALWAETPPGEGLMISEGEARRRTPAELRSTFPQLIAEHEAWLAQFGPRHLAWWRKRLADDRMVEGALWEALCRRWLVVYVDQIEPAEDARSGGPDFRCITRGVSFYVEAGCLDIDAVTEATGMSDVCSKGQSFAQRAEKLADVAERKLAQCQARDDAPTVLFLGTLHQLGAMLVMNERMVSQLLTGNPSISFQIHIEDDVQVGSSGPFSTTELHGAAFLAADGLPEDPIGPRNRHIAAVLVGGTYMFSARDPLRPAPMVGALHPDPVLAFDPLRALPGVPFLALEPEWSSGRLHVHEITCAPTARRTHGGASAGREALE